MNNKYLIAYGFLILFGIGIFVTLNQKKPVSPFDNSPITLPTSAPTTAVASPIAPTPPPITKLLIEDTQVGIGTAAANGNTITVNYTGMFTDGKVFDTSTGKQPLTVVIGTGQVIPGWDQGILGMKVGGKRRLIIPSSLAYGEKGAGGVIPPNATLVFDIELLDVK